MNTERDRLRDEFAKIEMKKTIRWGQDEPEIFYLRANAMLAEREKHLDVPSQITGEERRRIEDETAEKVVDWLFDNSDTSEGAARALFSGAWRKVGE